jgi:hypothetical protein
MKRVMKNRPPIVRQLVLVCMMTLSFVAGIGLCVVCSFEIWREFKREELGLKIESTGTSRRLAFLDDGSPVVSNVEWSRKGRDENLAYLDKADSRSVEVGKLLRGRSPANLRRHPRIAFLAYRPFFGVLPIHNHTRRYEPTLGFTTWHWESAPGSIEGDIIVARDQRTGAVTSVCTPEGFRNKLHKEFTGFQLPVDFRGTDGIFAFRSAGKLLLIDIDRRTVLRICEMKSDVKWTYLRRIEGVSHVVVQQPDALYVFDELGKQVGKLLLDDIGSKRFKLYVTKDEDLIVCPETLSTMPASGGTRQGTVTAMWLDRQGHVYRTVEFDEFEKIDSRMPDAPVVVRMVDDFLDKAEAGLGLPAPAILCSLLFVVMPSMLNTAYPGRAADVLIADALRRMPYSIPLAVAVGLLCAAACWRQQKRYRSDWTTTWIVFVFLFGLPGWLAWKFHQRWPPLELVKVFDTGFVGPEPNGLEIR